jgi:hypothetical protein
MIFTLPTVRARYTQGPVLYLDQFFSGNTLLLLDDDTESFEPDQWQLQLERIKQFVVDNAIELIVLNTAINPVQLDCSQNRHLPSYLEMQQMLAESAPTVILTSDYAYYYRPQPGVVFFPTFLWLNSARLMGQYFADRANTVYDIEFEQKTKTLMCLNSNTPWHRIYLFSLVAGRPWFDSIGYSFSAKTGHQQTLTFEKRLTEVAVTQFMSQQERDLAESYAHLLPVQIAGDSMDSKKSGVHSWIYQAYAINLITETSLTEGVMLTEKVCKAFTAYQIPILIGPAGACQFLEDTGLDMFSDYIPWKTWDSTADHKRRINMIVEFLDQLLLNPADILSTHQSFKSRLLKNKEYFHSPEFQQILLQQIKSYTK